MPELKGLLFLLTVALGLTMIGWGLGAFTMLARMLWGEQLERIHQRLELQWWRDVRLGALHAVALLALLSVAQGRPLLTLLGLIWLAVVAAALALAVPAFVERLSQRLQPQSPYALRGATLIVWGCALPYLGQAMLLLILLGCYAAGLATLLRRNPQAQVMSEKNSRISEA